MAQRGENMGDLLLILGGGGFLVYHFLLKPRTAAGPVNVLAPPVAVGAGAGTAGPAGAPRGIRNNNPGNIEFNLTNMWQGQTGSDGRYAKFNSPAHGIRALFGLLRTYINSHKLDTISKIASRWAPPAENNTAAYAANIAVFSGLAQNVPLSFANKGQMIALAKGMIGAENGAKWVNYYGNDVFNQAYGML